jgi:hypothetical protein
MAKVFGLHEIELSPGVTNEEYERFVREKVTSLANFPGWNWYLLKGDRGQRDGKYLLLLEIESVAARDRFAPMPDQESEEARKFAEAHPEDAAVYAELEKLGSVPGVSTLYTDYVVVAESAAA